MTISVTNTFVDAGAIDATQIDKNFTDLINATSDGTKNINVMSAAIGGALIASGDIYTAQLTDYSGTTVITGYSAIATKYVFYKTVGKTVLVWFYISATSNGNLASFTLPYTQNSTMQPNSPGLVIRYTDTAASVVRGHGFVNNAVFQYYENIFGGANITNGHTCIACGSFFYEAA